MIIRKMPLLFCCFCISCAKTTPPFLSDLDAISFQRGYSLYENHIDSSEIPYKIEQVIKGILSAAKGEQSLLSEEEISQRLMQLHEELLAKKMEENLAEAETILHNISKTALELIPSKLYYVPVSEGTGPSVSANDAPFVLYRVMGGDGKLIFSPGDSPVQISLPDTIPGFVQGVVGMLEGEKRILYIHPDLTSGQYPFLPNKLLMVEVEIVRAESQ